MLYNIVVFVERYGIIMIIANQKDVAAVRHDSQ